MKKFTTLLFMLLISFCFVLSGCGGANLKLPQELSRVYSNGGFVVSAGNYMYFANAYKDNTTLTDGSQNKGSSVAQYSLKRIELNTENKWFNIVKDEEENINYENVVNKIAGYQVSNMFVVNEYLYFTTPNVHKNDQNNYELNLSTLFRIKLNGSDMKELYTTKAPTAEIYLASTSEGKKILIYDDEKIGEINVGAKETGVNFFVENVKSVVFPKQEEQEVTYVYYTSDREDKDVFSGNILNKVNVVSGDTEEVAKVAGQTIKLIAQDYDRLFYIITKSNNESLGLFSNDVADFDSQTLHLTATEGIVDGGDLLYIKCTDNDYDFEDCFVFMYKDNLYLQLLSSTFDSQAIKLTEETTTIQFASGSYVYYSTTSGIYRYSVLSKQEQPISNKTNINGTTMDFDGRWVYFFAKGDNQETETEYLYRADTQSAEDMVTELIGELLEEDIVEEDAEK